MPNRRYHIHVICADNDQLLVLDSLAIFFQARAFLTYDVSSQLPKASLYGRQCIDSCDYALMLVGDSYGTVQKTGVSQMHLSYLNAKAKLKPLLILIKNHHQDASISRQLQEFINSVTKQDNKIYYYETADDIEKILVQAYYNAVTKRGATGGWIKAEDELTELSKTTAAQKLSERLPAKKVIHKKPQTQDDFADDTVSKPIILTESIDIHYSAQAYEGGNLTDVVRPMTLTWQEVLATLLKIPTAFSSNGLQNAINRLIASKAEQDIKQDMPNVHAVSRCQISQDDLNCLQRQLVGANWIQLATYGTRVSQELWKLTFYAKNLLKNAKPNP
ncbi:DUF4062 domain-containing protein [Psychrobacter sp. APC 3426]|uniref:DUF4062 domain-containing protein n=1 Tax=Psychrobacter sp. APC 3426 TaxID=3035177 RepID=UPI0025B45719|nr:DUF4062 domain-containing protein [Psychrobacter sp. APC 3426]MDN3399564.1 DUF4062 domain-containing protein [Psychrobacter sp. APC 3426]